MSFQIFTVWEKDKWVKKEVKVRLFWKKRDTIEALPGQLAEKTQHLTTGKLGNVSEQT